VNPDPERSVNRPFTFAVSFVSLLVGMILAALIGLPLLSLGQRVSADSTGNLTWSLGQLAYPLAAILTMLILSWSIFRLPLRIARRRGLLLDPVIWPITGAILLGVLIALGFVGAILLGLI